jgi:hypothetical protein
MAAMKKLDNHNRNEKDFAENEWQEGSLNKRRRVVAGVTATVPVQPPDTEPISAMQGRWNNSLKLPPPERSIVENKGLSDLIVESLVCGSLMQEGRHS